MGTGFIALGSRFAYIPALGLSLLPSAIAFGVLRILVNHRQTSRETTLSASALGWALLLPAAVVAVPVPNWGMEAAAMMMMGLGALCWIGLRCKLVDCRVASTLFFAALLKEIWPYLTSGDLPLDFYQFLVCVALALFWKHEFLTGALLAFTMWQNPYLAALVLLARAWHGSKFLCHAL